ncbi:unnamed protein product [Trichogramma brassicae]|uniref:Reverse transcriptase domain-containing protein n=1 Tax=Trichogramma brassicae TaxID=86971 RepID=A0A6H5IUA8_9HYME|nr:unnamed protein product [Trichogramma brassicae]
MRFLRGARRCPRSCFDKPVLPPNKEDQSSLPMMRILQLNLNHCKAAQDLLSQTILEQLINVAVVCDQYKNLDPPYTWLADANSQAVIWVQGGGMVQERPTRARPFFTWARINGIYFFSVYAPPRLADVEFSALLTNIIEEAWDKRPLSVAGDLNAWSTEWRCRVTRQRGTTLLDALATLEAALLNTGDTPTFAGALGYSIIDLTFASDTLAPRITSWAISELYTHSDHQAIVFEIETARPPRPMTRQSCKWNTRTLDSESLLVMMANAAVPPGPTEEMATRFMAAITSACDASMAKTSGRSRRCAVYWWTSKIADLRRSCLRARNLAQRAQVMSRLRRPRANTQSSPTLVRRIVDALFPRVPDELALPPPLQAGAIIPAITLEELQRLCRSIKDHTAPGPDGVPNSAIKIAIAKHPDIFLQVFMACLRTGVFPACWKRQKLALLPKPGKPPEEPSSYRPLCMLDTAAKILERIICDRLEATTESPGGLSDHQYGFWKGRSTINAIENVIAIAREAIAGTRWNRGTKKYCAVVTLDVKNAFNSARYNNINAALRRMRTPQYLPRIVGSYLSARSLDYDTEDGPESYRVTAGVPQESVLGPILWNVMYDAVLRLNFGGNVKIVGFADDIALVAVAIGQAPVADRIRSELYHRAAPIWRCATETQAYIRQAEAVHRRACLCVISGRPHVSYDTTYVIAGVPPLALLADERARTYQRRFEDVKEEERRETLSHSQRYDNTLSALCPSCLTTLEDAEHAFFRCPRFHEERKRLQQVLQEVIEPENIVRIMLMTSGNRMAVSSFAQSVVSRLRQEAQEV